MITGKSDLLHQDPEQLQENSNQILTAIIQGMRKEEPSNNVKLAATNALLNSLEFTKANFDKEVHGMPELPPSQCFCVPVNMSLIIGVCVLPDREALYHAGGV